jgi:hypothetical protein
MSFWTTLSCEMAYRRWNAVFGLLGIAGAAALFVGVLASLEIHAFRSEAIVHRRQAELQTDRQRLAALLVPGVAGGCAAWILLAALLNVRRRKFEVAVLRGLGCRAGQILTLFLSRAFLVGLGGALLGAGFALAAGVWLRGEFDLPLVGADGLVSWTLLIASLIIGTLIGVVAGWIPALVAAQQDPAHCSTNRRCCWRMNPPATWTPKTRPTCWTQCANTPTRVGRC